MFVFWENKKTLNILLLKKWAYNHFWDLKRAKSISICHHVINTIKEKHSLRWLKLFLLPFLGLRMSQLMYNVGNDLSFIWYIRKVIHLAFITILHLSFMIRPLQNKRLSSTYYISIFVGTITQSLWTFLVPKVQKHGKFWEKF